MIAIPRANKKLENCPLIEIDDIKFKACLEILDKFMDELDHSLLYGKARD